MTNEADIRAQLNERHGRIRNAFIRKDLAAYRGMFSADLHYRQADGRAIDREQLMQDVAAQFRRLDGAETSSIRDAFEIVGADYIETVRQSARATATAFGFIRRTWEVDRHARWTWTNEAGVLTIVRVEVLEEKVRSRWRFGRRAQAPT